MDFIKLLREERLRQKLCVTRSGPGTVIAGENESTSRNDHPACSRIANAATDNAQEDIAMPDFSFPAIEFGRCRVGENFHSVYYIQDALDPRTEESILTCIEREGAKGPDVWKQLRTRRLQCWGRIIPPTQGRCESSNYTDTDSSGPTSFPSWLSAIIDALVRASVFSEADRPNHVLINEYSAHEGIMHHTDGPAYLDRVAILSLGTPCVMTFRRRYTERPSEESVTDNTGIGKEIGKGNESTIATESNSNIGLSQDIGYRHNQDVFSLVLQPRSLLVFTGDVYSEYMHGIADGKTVQIVGADAPCVNAHLAGVSEGDEVSLYALQ